MRRLRLASILLVVGCGRGRPESDRLAQGVDAVVYDRHESDIIAHTRDGEGWHGVGFVTVQVGDRVTVLDDAGSGDDREVRVGVKTPDYRGPARIPRKNLRPAR